MKNLTAFALAAAAAIYFFFATAKNSEVRAVHADESEQAFTFLNLYEGKGYKYNPYGPHGPALYYWAYAAQKPQGIPAEKIEIAQLRKCLLPAAAALGAAYFALAGTLGAAACALAAAVFFASPIAQIYSVYFVHEILFALACFLCTAAAFFFLKKPSAARAAAAGFAAGAAQCCKETSVIAFAAIFAAAVLVKIAFKNPEDARETQSPKRCALWAFAALAGFSAVLVPLYSSFGTNFGGVADAFKSYFIHFFSKADSAEIAGEGLFYAKLLFWQKSGGAYFGGYFATALALLGTFWAFVKRRERGADAAAFFAVSALVQIVILSFIKYKTPWLLLAPTAAMCVPAGYALAKILSLRARLAIPALALVAAAFVPQYKMSRNATERFADDPRNPLIYSHTVRDEKNLEARIAECVKFSEYSAEIPVAFVGEVSPWPLPWAMRNMPNAGFWRKPPDNLDKFDVIIADAFAAPETLKKFDRKKYVGDMFGLRKNTILNVFIKKELFDKITGEKL